MWQSRHTQKNPFLGHKATVTIILSGTHKFVYQKKAQHVFSNGKVRFFQRWSLWSGGPHAGQRALHTCKSWYAYAAMFGNSHSCTQCTAPCSSVWSGGGGGLWCTAILLLPCPPEPLRELSPCIVPDTAPEGPPQTAHCTLAIDYLFLGQGRGVTRDRGTLPETRSIRWRPPAKRTTRVRPQDQEAVRRICSSG